VQPAPSVDSAPAAVTVDAAAAAVTADAAVAATAAQPAPLRAWQRSALVSYLRSDPQDWLAVATPGAGKTTFALRVAGELLQSGQVQAVTVVAPTEHLKTQWALAASKVGIPLDPTFRNAMGQTSADFVGAVVTYAQVAAHPRCTAPAPTAAARW
jgi:superfamily II DNA or RNA helicase